MDQNSLSKCSGGTAVVECTYSDGTSWVGRSNNTETIMSMWDHCDSSGGSSGSWME